MILDVEFLLGSVTLMDHLFNIAYAFVHFSTAIFLVLLTLIMNMP